MAEFADAQDLGSCGNTVQVQVLSPAPIWAFILNAYVIMLYIFACVLFMTVPLSIEVFSLFISSAELLITTLEFLRGGNRNMNICVDAVVGFNYTVDTPSQT